MTNDIFSPPTKKSKIDNQRTAVRYTSSCNKAIVILKKFFMPTKFINIKVIDISSQGARISSKYKFKRKTKIIFKIKIKGGLTWETPAKIVRLYDHQEFGVTFDHKQHDLIDQIMHSEDDFSVSHLVINGKIY
jgi:hypothetical protein